MDYHNIAAECLNNILSNIKEWADTWRVSFNPVKTECMVFSNMKPVQYTTLMYDNRSITEVKSQKHQGVVLNSKLTLSLHVDSFRK